MASECCWHNLAAAQGALDDYYTTGPGVAKDHTRLFGTAAAIWRVRQDLNLQPSDPKSEALSN